MLTSKEFGMSQVIVITTYEAQRSLLDTMILDLAKKLNVHACDLPTVINIGAAQSKEWDFCTVDLVRTNWEKKGDIGFLSDNRRIHTVMTRSKKLNWIVACIRLHDGFVNPPISRNATDVTRLLKIKRAT